MIDAGMIDTFVSGAQLGVVAFNRIVAGDAIGIIQIGTPVAVFVHADPDNVGACHGA